MNKKKSFLLLFLCICLILPTAVMFTACGKKKEKHTHSFGVEYKMDTFCHWLECGCGEKSEKQEHQFNSGKCSVCGFVKETDGLEMVYSSDIDAFKVAGIGSAAEKHIKIPSSYTDSVNGSHLVASIKGSAFQSCNTLVSVTIPTSVTLIESGAFNSCKNLTTVTFEEGSNCEGIGNTAFSGCSSLSEMVIPEKVTNIAGEAFRRCTELTAVTIPASVTTIGKNPFLGCTSLTSLTVDEENEKYYSQNNCIIEKETGKLVSALSNSVIPTDGSVTSIGALAFAEINIARVIIPASVTKIESSAFKGCVKLISVTFEDGGRCGNIGMSVFEGCTALGTITIPKNVVSLGSRAFYNCTWLSNITISSGISSIGNNTFYGCSRLKNVYYTGSSAAWSSINIDSGNDSLKNATIHCY